MTSPLRFEADLSMIEGEKLSPIKIPPTKLSAITKSPDVLAKHPHGLRAKHDARRNTLHDTPKGLTATPLTKKAEPLYSVSKRIPLTSPRATNQPDLESLKKSKTKLDARLHELKSSSRISSPSNKENMYISGKKTRTGQLSSEIDTSMSHKSPFESSPTKVDTPIKQINSSFTKGAKSSPVQSSPSKADKRSVEEDITIDNARKIARVITNANESEAEAHKSEDEHLVQIDQVFNKEDLVGRLSSGGLPQKLQAAPVIDDDSDGDIYSNEINTSHTMTSKFRGNESTQLSKIIRLTNEVDYVTPQRYTEPVAKSPETNQQHRTTETIPQNIELKDSTSPSKNHRLSVSGSDKANATADNLEDDNSEFEHNDLEEEPTINFLMSPNSKPVFSLDHIKKVQEEHFNEVESLEEVINNKNQEILRFSEELSATNNKFLIFDQKIKELKQEKKKLIVNENLLSVQLKHNERELASTTKALKIKENYALQLESRLSKYKSKCESSSNKLESCLKECDSLKEHIAKLEKSVENNESSQREYESQIKILGDDVTSKNKEISSLTDANIDYNIKIENLLREKEELLTETGRLGRENNSLEEINSKQQELLEELDKLETLAKDKISSLENSLEVKSQEVKQAKVEKNELLTKIDKLTEENKSMESDLQREKDEIKELTNKLNKYDSSRDDLGDQVRRLQEELKKGNETNEDLQKKVDELMLDIERLNRTVSDSVTQVDLLKSINTEKDEIISGDTKKMGELVQKVNKQKQIIADYEKDYSKALEDIKSLLSKRDSTSLNEEIEDLKKQVSQGQAKTNARIQEVAEQLYFEYSKKHELKVNQVRASFKKQIDNLNLEKKSQARDIDSLQKKLEIVNMEKNQLLRLIDEYQSVSDNKPKNKLSPKKSGIKKSLRY